MEFLKEIIDEKTYNTLRKQVGEDTAKQLDEAWKGQTVDTKKMKLIPQAVFKDAIVKERAKATAAEEAKTAAEKQMEEMQTKGGDAEAIKKQLEEYKAEVERKTAEAAEKQQAADRLAYKHKVLKEAGAKEDRIELLAKLFDDEEISLDDKGNFHGGTKAADRIKELMAENFTRKSDGAGDDDDPLNAGGGDGKAQPKGSMDDFLAGFDGN